MNMERVARDWTIVSKVKEVTRQDTRSKEISTTVVFFYDPSNQNNYFMS